MANKDSVKSTLLVVFGLCVVCSLVVSTAAVVLKPIQQENKLLDKQRYILEAANLIQPANKYTKKQVLDIYNSSIKAEVINLKTGDLVKGVDPQTFDEKNAVKYPEQSFKPEHDIALVRRVSNNVVIYLAFDKDKKVKSVILPIHGYGLWSTMYAFLAIDKDLNTVQNLIYYVQMETPGLGSEVMNPKWKAKWHGKQLFDQDGKLAIKVTKNPEIAQSKYGVDALSGATLTSNGVQHSLEFWLGPEGYAKFLEKAHKGGIKDGI